MRNIKLTTLLLAVGMFLLSSCEKQLDINTDPLVATSADPNVVLPYVIVQYSNRFITELGTRIMDVPQHFAFCFNSPRNGATTIFLTGNTWGMYYTQVLGNLELVEADALAAGESSNNVAAIAKILKAKSFFELSCIWERVPFSQAIDGAQFPSPAFDDQEAIFRGAITLLDEAIDLIGKIPETGIFDVSQGDVIFEGDMSKWERWANSLKLRILMLLRNKANVDSEINAVLSQPLIETNDQAAILRYFDAPGQSNAFQQIVEAFFGPSNEGSSVHGPGVPIYDLLKDSGDPRFELYIDDRGTPINGSQPNAERACYRDVIIRNDLPHIMFLPSEINFYRAELALTGIGSDAQAHFDKGLTQILEFWGQDIPGAKEIIDDTVIQDFVSSRDPVSLQAVYEQLYLESFIRPVVAWNTVRRTKVPELDPPSNTTITTYLKRFTYPPDEIASNPNTPANQNTDVPMWFEN